MISTLGQTATREALQRAAWLAVAAVYAQRIADERRNVAPVAPVFPRSPFGCSALQLDEL